MAPDSKVHGANMEPIWGQQGPGGPHVGPMNFAIWGSNNDEQDQLFITKPCTTMLNKTLRLLLDILYCTGNSKGTAILIILSDTISYCHYNICS